MLPQFGLDALYQIGGYTNIKRSKAVTGRKIYARLFFHSGMVAHPCNLDSGDPCRNDGVLGLAETTSNLVRFYVASLRRCVKPSFTFLAVRHVHSKDKDFLSHATTQR